MTRIDHIPLPPHAFLDRFSSEAGAHTDCYVTEVPAHVDLERFIATFFDTWVFRLERKLLAIFARQSSGQEDVKALAHGASEKLAMWRLVERDENQILLRVGDGPIRSWLMRSDLQAGTQLYFGSALLAVAKDKRGNPSVGFFANALMGFHRLYSRILLQAAARKLSSA
ncbi:hypothetical protein [Planktotalea sp.]|uniref:hypothetical protein n=1 Tax=Planktotalea sp. TaxID=2029877 RepID=UPI003297EB11